jgi:glycosyltransferase involved in cell wall biosynthesis
MRRYEGKGTRIVFSGSWIERKGILQVVEAFSHLATKYEDLRLGVLGAGIEASRVHSYFHESLHSRITIYTPTSHESSAKILLDYDIFLLPSFFEGGPLTLVEAMYSGLPAITTSTWLRNLVRDGQNCLVVAPGDTAAIVRALETLIMDPGLRERIGRQGHDDATRQQTWPALAEIVNHVYCGLLKNR